MKILLAAGVFYPDVGGPAIHVRKIAERLSVDGYAVRVVAYGDDPTGESFPFKVSRVSRSLPKPLQWLIYLLLVLRHSASSQIVYAFDPTAAGVPARIASIIFGRPFFIRIGGDPIWEREAEAGRRLMPIEEYYKQGLHLEDRPTLYRVIRWLLRSADVVVVYNRNFKDFYSKYFGVPVEKLIIIKNPVFRRELGSAKLPQNPVILFAGRFVAYKNLDKVIEAYRGIGIGKLLFIGSGPEEERLRSTVRHLGLESVEFKSNLPQESLFEEIKKSAICIGPALSEFNPNFILEALSFGKPVLLSRGHGLSVELPDEFLFDSQDAGDLQAKMRDLLTEENYAKAVSIVNSMPLNISWDDVTRSHLDIIKKWTPPA